MRNIIVILIIFFHSFASAQINIGSKAYTASANVIPEASTVTFKKGGYADYPVTIQKEGKYNFVIKLLNLNHRAIYVYIYSTSAAAWLKSVASLSNSYQNISVSVPLSIAATSMRLYFADSAIVDNISYSLDNSVISAGTDVTALVNRIASLESKLSAYTGISMRIDTVKKSLDSVRTIKFSGFNFSGDTLSSSPLKVTLQQRLDMKNVSPGMRVWQTDGNNPGEYGWSVKSNGWVFKYN